MITAFRPFTGAVGDRILGKGRRPSLSPAASFVLAVFLAVSGPGALMGQAQAAKLIKKIKDWTIYEHKSGNDRLCFITSRPKKMRPKKVIRGDVMFYVSTWPGQGVYNEVSVKMGYHLAPDSTPEVKIDKKSFKMSINKDRGYINSAEQERAFVAAMRRGTTMSVYGLSKRGTKTTDTYSLSGVTKALNTLSQMCK